MYHHIGLRSERPAALIGHAEFHTAYRCLDRAGDCGPRSADALVDEIAGAIHDPESRAGVARHRAQAAHSRDPIRVQLSS